jgi:hypothetical protein
MTCVETGIYICSYLALLVATAAFLWHPNESKSELYENYEVCNDPYTRVQEAGISYPKYDGPCSSYVNVYVRFTNILQLYFAFYII